LRELFEKGGRFFGTQCRWLGHVFRHENFFHIIIKGKMLGNATPGRKRVELGLLHDIMEMES